MKKQNKEQDYFIAVLNEGVYEISEGTYNKIMKTYLIKKPLLTNDNPRSLFYDKEQSKRCEIIRKHGRKIMNIDVHLRDD